MTRDAGLIMITRDSPCHRHAARAHVCSDKGRPREEAPVITKYSAHYDGSRVPACSQESAENDSP